MSFFNAVSGKNRIIRLHGVSFQNLAKKKPTLSTWFVGTTEKTFVYNVAEQTHKGVGGLEQCCTEGFKSTCQKKSSSDSLSIVRTTTGYSFSRDVPKLTKAPASLSSRPEGWWWFYSRYLDRERGQTEAGIRQMDASRRIAQGDELDKTMHHLFEPLKPNWSANLHTKHCRQLWLALRNTTTV